MNNPNLAHVAEGDRILSGDVETEIAAVLADGVRLTDGRFLSEHDFFNGEILVIPDKAPAEVAALIAAQPARHAKNCVVVRCLSGNGQPRFTIADRKTGSLLRASIHTGEDAEVSFCDGRWEEGKPEMADCWTEYFVGEEDFEAPDDFEPERYL